MIFEPEKHPNGTLTLPDSQRRELAERGHDSSRIHTALLRLYDDAKAVETSPARESNLPPCGTCGGTDFIATGNCHACRTCGESQGCS